MGVLATSQTLASSRVAQLCADYGSDVEILLTACPGLVEQVELAELASETTRSLLLSYISPLLEAGQTRLFSGAPTIRFSVDSSAKSSARMSS